MWIISFAALVFLLLGISCLIALLAEKCLVRNVWNFGIAGRIASFQSKKIDFGTKFGRKCNYSKILVVIFFSSTSASSCASRWGWCAVGVLPLVLELFYNFCFVENEISLRPTNNKIDLLFKKQKLMGNQLQIIEIIL